MPRSAVQRWSRPSGLTSQIPQRAGPQQREAVFYSDSTNYMIDLDHAVIVDVEATTSVRQAEITAQRRMTETTQERFGLWPERLVADAAQNLRKMAKMRPMPGLAIA